MIDDSEHRTTQEEPSRAPIVLAILLIILGFILDARLG